MRCDPRHLKGYCILGLIAMVLGTATLTWGYPLFLDRVAEIKAEKSSELCSTMFGISVGAARNTVRTGSVLRGSDLRQAPVDASSGSRPAD